jgi:hypothetical protein
MLATVEQLRMFLPTAGTVSAGAAIDGGLLELLLSSADKRIRQELPERTLDVRPALTGDPPADLGEPVEVRLTLSRPTSIVQVPDLRDVVSIATVGPSYDAAIAPVPRPVAGYTLMRRPRHACALWVKFPTPIVGDELVIVGRWGPADAEIGDPLEVNAAARDACLVWAARAYYNRSARFADRTQDPSGGGLDYFRTLPSDVASTINALRIPGA